MICQVPRLPVPSEFGCLARVISALVIFLMWCFTAKWRFVNDLGFCQPAAALIPDWSLFIIVVVPHRGERYAGWVVQARGQSPHNGYIHSLALSAPSAARGVRGGG